MVELYSNGKGMPYPPLDKYMFEGCIINGIYISPVAAFDNDAIWYNDLISKIPKMGEEFMALFINCSGHAYIFLDLAQEITNELHKPKL